MGVCTFSYRNFRPVRVGVGWLVVGPIVQTRSKTGEKSAIPPPIENELKIENEYTISGCIPGPLTARWVKMGPTRKQPFRFKLTFGIEIQPLKPKTLRAAPG